MGAPASRWYLAMAFVVSILNVTALKSLQWKTPTEVAFGTTPDISPFLQFDWNDLVVYHTPNKTFPHTQEATGRFVGVCPNIGDALTYFILTEDTEQVIARSNVRPFTPEDASTFNRRVPNAVQPKGRNSDKKATDYDGDLIKSTADVLNHKRPIISPDDLIGLSFLAKAPTSHKEKATVDRKVEDNKMYHT